MLDTNEDCKEIVWEQACSPKLIDFQMIPAILKPLTYCEDGTPMLMEEVKGFIVFLKGKQLFKKTWNTGKYYIHTKTLNKGEPKEREDFLVIYSPDGCHLEYAPIDRKDFELPK